MNTQPLIFTNRSSHAGLFPFIQSYNIILPLSQRRNQLNFDYNVSIPIIHQFTNYTNTSIPIFITHDLSTQLQSICVNIHITVYQLKYKSMYLDTTINNSDTLQDYTNQRYQWTTWGPQFYVSDCY